MVQEIQELRAERGSPEATLDPPPSSLSPSSAAKWRLRAEEAEARVEMLETELASAEEALLEQVRAAPRRHADGHGNGGVLMLRADATRCET
eukprot:1922596-Pyramimonas_sp.AAC.2